MTTFYTESQERGPYSDLPDGVLEETLAASAEEAGVSLASVEQKALIGLLVCSAPDREDPQDAELRFEIISARSETRSSYVDPHTVTLNEVLRSTRSKLESDK